MIACSYEINEVETFGGIAPVLHSIIIYIEYIALNV